MAAAQQGAGVGSTLEARVIRLIADHFGRSSDLPSLDASLCEDLGADSLDYVELALAFEEEFDIEVDDDAAAKAVSVRDLVDLVRTAREGR